MAGALIPCAPGPGARAPNRFSRAPRCSVADDMGILNWAAPQQARTPRQKMTPSAAASVISPPHTPRSCSRRVSPSSAHPQWRAPPPTGDRLSLEIDCRCGTRGSRADLQEQRERRGNGAPAAPARDSVAHSGGTARAALAASARTDHLASRANHGGTIGASTRCICGAATLVIGDRARIGAQGCLSLIRLKCALMDSAGSRVSRGSSCRGPP